MAPGLEDNPGPVPPNIICCRWLYAAANTPKPVPMMQIAKKAMPMIGYFMLALLLITFIPAISLCLL